MQWAKLNESLMPSDFADEVDAFRISFIKTLE